MMASLWSTLSFIDKIGIYKIGFNQTKKFYVGHTCSKKGFKKRFSTHLTALKTNVHINKALQGAFRKYGIENVFFEILEHYDYNSVTKHFLQEIETAYIHKYNLYGSGGYNLTKDGFGKKRHGTLLMDRMSKVKSKEAFVYNFDGKYLWSFDKKKNLNKFLRVTNAYRTKLVSGIYISNGYLVTNEKADTLDINLIGEYLMYDLNGNFVKAFINSNHIKDYFGIFGRKDLNNMYACLEGKRQSFNGYLWRKKERLENLQETSLPVYKRKTNGFDVTVTHAGWQKSRTFSSLAEACNEIKVPYKKASLYLKAGNGSYRGYLFTTTTT